MTPYSDHCASRGRGCLHKGSIMYGHLQVTGLSLLVLVSHHIISLYFRCFVDVDTFRLYLVLLVALV